MRPIWKGAVSFGLVFVPVKMYAATERKDVRFNYLHEKCRNPIQYRRYCPYCEKEVPLEELVRGYEYEKGRYVVLRDEDMAALSPGQGHNIEILDFVNLAEIDPIYYDKAYYLAPGDGGEKVYELLRRAMEETNKVAVARVTIRSKSGLAVLRATRGVLTMSTMFYPDEVRDAGAIEEARYRVDVQEKELQMAIDLINSLSASFNPEKYTDEYRQALMELIQARVAGEQVTGPARPQAARVVDLMEALRASIEKAQQERGREAAGGDGEAVEKGANTPRRRGRKKAVS
ncbi:Ku protein [Desulfofundulus thermobenzoicus]|uniref:Non-homologous end joining protein Ku n=1 Tax=Desulfofundulus thermobenzoicus TaxID=29376 RepID=A0A6N7INU5_9FIRM|nr:Ku protein [Desulfofundulus thermobenzoicus]MQL51267.1 Ku protein [Desulfofundulus thermobenzoicus]